MHDHWYGTWMKDEWENKPTGLKMRSLKSSLTIDTMKRWQVDAMT